MAIAVREVVTASSEGTTQVNLGAGTAAGDLLLLVNGTDFYTVADMGTPSGGGTWNGPVAVANQGTNDFHLQVWWAVVDAGGAQSITVTQSGNDACNHVRVRVLTGANTADPIDDAAGSTTDQTAPALTPATADALLCCDVLGSSGTYTSPGSMVAEPQQNCDTFSTSDGAHEQLTASGDTGTRTWNAGSVATSAAIRTAADETPAEGTAAYGLGLQLQAAGSRPSAGSAGAGLGLQLAAAGARDSAGVAPLGLGLTLQASGVRASQGEAHFALGLRLVGSSAPPAETPAERTLTVLAELRRLTVAAETRTLTIPAEERTLHVQ